MVFKAQNGYAILSFGVRFQDEWRRNAATRLWDSDLFYSCRQSCLVLPRGARQHYFGFYALRQFMADILTVNQA
ncbi:hypothetical protein Pse7429DRAFT_3611 [Pseudanabaena biceps PCC 7429]|uniref:Uncharacterized protein n=1 Tax=Pseudanabaena biceps PCC 7429 TaxID=927668 RepID=L8MZA7_9CYAN|nr:hypothetical protein Pse7429DRAFT_3611 [Pseudanabaena biceps PCC 7429]